MAQKARRAFECQSYESFEASKYSVEEYYIQCVNAFISIIHDSITQNILRFTLSRLSGEKTLSQSVSFLRISLFFMEKRAAAAFLSAVSPQTWTLLLPEGTKQTYL